MISRTVDGRPIGDRLSIKSLGVFRCIGVQRTPGATAFYADSFPGVFHRQVLGDRFQTPLGDHRHRRRDPPDRVARQGCRDRDDAAAGLLRQHLPDDKSGLLDVRDAGVVRRSRTGSGPEELAVTFDNGDVVDAGFPATHQAVVVEFPEFVAIAAEPLA